MSTTSILIAGVGGQGLVLATNIISHVAFKEGLDVKTSDVIGLSQRGGMVWGCVRFGGRVHSPLIPAGLGDYLVAMEDLEGLRWSKLMKPCATIITAKKQVLPNRVLLEKDEYPANVVDSLLKQGFQVKTIDADRIAREIGNSRLSNTVLLGHLSTYLPFANETWLQVIRESVPPKTIELNERAFQEGRRS